MMLDDYNNANEAIAKKNADLASALANKYKGLFSGQIGEEILLDLSKLFNHPATYLPGVNPTDCAYYEGQRSVITYINNQRNYIPYGTDHPTE